MKSIDEDPGILATTTVPIKVSIIIFLLCAVFIFTFFFIDTAKVDSLKFVMSVIGTGCVLYTAFYAGINLKNNIVQSKMKASFEMLAKLNELNSTEVRDYIENNIDHDNISPKECYEKLANNSDMHSKMLSLLGHFEDISIAVQLGYVDERAMYLSLSYVFPWVNTKLKGYLAFQRENISKDIYCEFNKLSNAWAENRFLKDSKPIRLNGN